MATRIALNWRTTLCGALLAGLELYKSSHDYTAAILAAAIFALGALAKD